MKKITLHAILFSVILTSCSTEEVTIETEAAATSGAPMEYLQRGARLPENRLNPHDNTGLAYYEILDSHFSNSNPGMSTDAMMVSIHNAAMNSAAFQTLPDFNNAHVDIDAINAISTTSTNLNATISTSQLSTSAKVMLQSFVNTLEYNILNNTSDDVYNLIIAFEASVASPTSGLTASDKTAIFTIGSVTRYSNDLLGDDSPHKWKTMKSEIATVINFSGNLGNAVLNAAAISILE